MQLRPWFLAGSVATVIAGACARVGTARRAPSHEAPHAQISASVRAPEIPPSPVEPAPTTPFHLVATGEGLQLFGLDGATLVTLGCSTGGPFAAARIVGDDIELTNALAEGWQYCVVCGCDLQGWWPDHVYRPAPRVSGDGCGTHELNVKRGKVWKPIPGPGGGFLVVSPWSRGRRLALGQDCAGYFETVALDAKDRIVAARDRPSLPRELGQTQAFAAFTSGEILLLLSQNEEVPRLAVWVSGAKKPTIHPLSGEGSDWSIAGMMAIAPNDVFVSGTTSKRGFLERFDGARWTVLEPPALASIERMYPARDGGLWFVGPGSKIWHRSSSGSFDSLELPAGVVVSKLVEVAPGDLWLSTDSALYHNRPVSKPKAIVSDCPALFQNEDNAAGQPLTRCNPRLEPINGAVK